MNGYKAFYHNRETEVYAETSYAAQVKAAMHFKAKKRHEVHVMLCETNCTAPGEPGKQYTHSTAGL